MATLAMAYQRGYQARAATVNAHCPYRRRDMCEQWEAGYQDRNRERLGWQMLGRPEPPWTDWEHWHDGAPAFEDYHAERRLVRP